MPIITLSDGTRLEANPNQRLVLAIEDSGIDIMHQCGGNARCTTCRVHFIDGEPQRMTAAEHTRLEARGLLGEYRLSCQILCFHDMNVEIVNRVSTANLGEAGPRPADQITPIPTWMPRP